jgi:hypothetical protein
MILSCPRCRVEIAAIDINMQTVMALCRTCNELFNFANIPVKTDRPAGTKIQYTQYGDGFGLIFPRGRTISLAIFLIIFGLIWAGVTGVMLGAVHFSLKHSPSAFFNAFISLFFISGLGFMLAGTVLCFLKTAMIAADGKLRIVRSIFSKEFVKEIPAELVSSVEKVARYQENDISVYGIKILSKDGPSYKVGNGLNDLEINWIRWLILEYTGARA